MSNLEASIQKAKEFLFRRQGLYQAVFKKDDLAVLEVLEDLAEFCRADSSTLEALEDGGQRSLVLQGRREVWLRIYSHINFSRDKLWKRHRKVPE